MSNSPLAGRPPFAIDDDNVKYTNPATQPRRQVQKPDNPNDRSSAYNTYDNYLEGNDRPDARMSAHGAIGGLMGGNMSDDESDDDGRSKAPVKSKNQALFEAAVAKPSGKSADIGPSNTGPSDPIPPPAYQNTNSTAALAVKHGMEKRAPGMTPGGAPPSQPTSTGLGPSSQLPVGPNARPGATSPKPPAAPIQITIPHAAPQPQRLQPAFMGNGPPPHPHPGQGGAMLSPFPYQNSPVSYSTPNSPSFPPTPIQPAFIGPSSTPIQPAFIKWGPDPEKSPISRGSSSVMSHESTIPILRGNNEETLLAKSRGPGVGPRPGMGRRTDGDDFWRRFSMVVKKEKVSPAEKTSPWLKKNLRRGSGFSRWVWVIGIILLLVVVGGAVTIWWFTRGDPDHQLPVAIGGGASQTMTNTALTKSTSSEAPKATVNNRPLITGTATFGTTPIVDKRAIPTIAVANPAKRDSDFAYPAAVNAAQSIHRRATKNRQQH